MTNDQRRTTNDERPFGGLRAGSATNDGSGRLASILRLALIGLGLALAVLPAALPYFGSGFPRTNDAFPHLFRVLVLDRMVQAGVLWPRWSPDLVHGHGYPVFNFFPALSHLLVELYHLAGSELAMAYRLAVLSHFWLAAWGTYALGNAIFGPAAGWVAALAYTYSPYLLYDAHVRGGLPESQALAFLPFLLLALWQASQGRRRWIAASALAFAAVFLSHYPVTYQLMIPTALWLLLLAWRQGWRYLIGPAVGLGLGVLLTAFFWLPALVEIGDTRAAFSISQGYEYQDNFLSLRQLVAWPQLPADPAFINPPVVRALPAVALLWAIFHLAWRWRRLGHSLRWQVGMWAAVFLLSAWLITPLSRTAWTYFPLLDQTLYPWRFLGIASLAVAMLLAAAVAGEVRQGTRPNLLLALMTALLVTAAIPWLYPPREPVPEAPTLADLVAFEQPPYFVGTTTLGEFLPRWVQEWPDTSALRQELQQNREPERLEAAEGVTIQQVDGRPWDATYQLHATQPATLTYRQFYFPGWQASLNGQPLPLRPNQPHGLLEVSLPPGEHTLHLAFKNTLPRTIGWSLSAIGLLLSTLTLIAPPQILQLANWPTGQLANSLPRSPAPLLLALLALALWLFFSYVDTPLRRPALQADGILGRPLISPVDYAGELRLLSYEQSSEQIAAGEPVQLTLYWQALRPIGVVYDAGIQIVDENGVTWNTLDTHRPPDWRFVSGNDPWPLESYRMDPFVLRLLDGTPPGCYTFHVGLVRRDTGQTVAVHQLSQLEVTRPARGERPLEDGMQPAPAVAHAQGLRLLGTRLDRRQAVPGGPLRITLLWQVIDPASVLPGGQFGLRLITEQGETVVVTTAAVAPAYPPSQWQAGDRLRSEVVLRLPAATPAGELTWHVILPGDPNASLSPSWEIGSLHIQELARQWTAPTLDVQTGAQLDEQVMLLGATLATGELGTAGQLPVTLVWRAEREMATSYHVFLHLLGPDGRLVAQSDGEPANWSRPTTGWLPGEIVLDERLLIAPPDLPAGTYTLVAGLYEPASGRRLISAGGAGTIFLTSLSLP